MARPSLNRRNAIPAAGRPWGVVALTAAALACAPAANRCRADAPPPAAGQMTITGRVVGPDGKGVANGRLALTATIYRRSQKPEGTWFAADLAMTTRLLATGKCDADGRFRLAGPGYSPSLPYIHMMLSATAPGHALIFVPVDPALARQDVTVKLPLERVVRGRLIDLQGQPAVGVRVGLEEGWLSRGERAPFWPRAVTTDDKGRFLLRGLGPGKAELELHHERFAPQQWTTDTVPLRDGKEATHSLVAARRFTGRVSYADTKQPAAGLRVIVISSNEDNGMGGNHVEARTDREGHVTTNTFPGDYLRIVVHPRDGTPYRTLREVVPWALAEKQGVDLSLRRGVLVRGKVIEAGTGRPVAGARVQFRPRANNNPFFKQTFQAGGDEENLETAISGPDGRFRLAALPGPGHLLVLGPTLDYLPVEASWGQLEYGRPGGMRYYPDALVSLNLKPDAQGHELAVELHRGITVRGRVVGPDGKPVERFRLWCRSYRPTGFEWWQRDGNVLQGRDGRFELPGCDPRKPFTAWFLDAKHQRGATAELSAKPGHPPVTVRLEPCGSAVARYVDVRGKPMVNYYPFFAMVVTPGASMACSILTGHDDKKDLEADWFGWTNALGGPPYADLRTNAQGRTSFPSLIPGATYRIMLPEVPRGGQQQIADKGFPKRDFTVKPGETLDLGDITFRDR